MLMTKIFKFESAHNLLNYEGACSNLHGHSYELHVSLKGNTLVNGMLVDFSKLKEIVQRKVISKLDHAYLNDIVTQPTAEHIAQWIFSQLSWANNDAITLHSIKLYETATSFIEYKGEEIEDR